MYWMLTIYVVVSLLLYVCRFGPPSQLCEEETIIIITIGCCSGSRSKWVELEIECRPLILKLIPSHTRPWCLQSAGQFQCFKNGWRWRFSKAVVGLNKFGLFNPTVSNNGASAYEGRIHRLAPESVQTPMTTASTPTLYIHGAFYLFSFSHLSAFCSRLYFHSTFHTVLPGTENLNSSIFLPHVSISHQNTNFQTIPESWNS